MSGAQLLGQSLESLVSPVLTHSDNAMERVSLFLLTWACSASAISSLSLEEGHTWGQNKQTILKRWPVAAIFLSHTCIFMS